MNGDVYLLLIDSDESVPEKIYSGLSSLKVGIYDTERSPFIAQADEIQLYAFVDGKLKAFQTEDVDPEDVIDLLSAIKWYLNYIGCPDAEILPDDPRTGHNIAV